VFVCLSMFFSELISYGMYTVALCFALSTPSLGCTSGKGFTIDKTNSRKNTLLSHKFYGKKLKVCPWHHAQNFTNSRRNTLLFLIYSMVRN